MKLEEVSISSLVNRPIKWTSDFESRMLQHVRDEFDEDEQQWYSMNFYMYLNYSSQDEYPVDLSDVYIMIGFANKQNARRSIVNNFEAEHDYKVIVSNDRHGRGRKEEHIMMNVDTFKNLCMLIKTEQGKKIRRYYIKLENVLNKVIKQDMQQKELELEEQKKQLTSVTKQLEEKKQILEDIKSPINTIYIGVHEGIDNCYKIGITEKITTRESQHMSSNTQYKMVYTYNTRNAKNIEDMIKLLLKPYRRSKPEWFNINYDHMKIIFDFVVMTYDTYHITQGVDNVVNYVKRYNSNRLVNTCKTRELVDIKYYNEFIDTHVTTGTGKKISCEMLCDGFEAWMKENHPSILDTLHLRGQLGRLSVEFKKEFMNKISTRLDLEYKTNISFKDPNGTIHAKVSGFAGISLVNIENGGLKYYEDDAYRLYCKEFITSVQDPRCKVSRAELLEHFVTWAREKQNNSTVSIYGKKGVVISPVFKDFFVKQIKQYSGCVYNHSMCKRNHIGCFKGMKHTAYEFKGNIFPERSEEDIKTKLIKSWTTAPERTNIAKLYKYCLENGDVTFEKVKEIMKFKDNRDIVANKNKSNWYLIFEKTETGYKLI